MKSPELVLEFLAPEFADLSRAHHHEHLLGLGQQVQDVVHEPGEIVGGRDGGVVLAKRRACQISLIDRREQERCVGKELPSIPKGDWHGQPVSAWGKHVQGKAWLVSLVQYDLGFFDHETCRTKERGKPFAASPMSSVSVTESLV